MGEGKKKKLT